MITPPGRRAGGRAAALVAEGEGRLPRDPGPASPDDRLRLQRVQAADHQAADRAAHGARQRRDAGGVRGLPRGPRGRGAGPPPGVPHHGHLLLPRPGHLRGPVPRGPASAAEGSAARRAGAGVGARVRHRRGGLFDRHLPAGSRGRAGDESLLPGLRHRPLRERRGEGAVGTVPAAHRPGRLAGTPAAVLHRGGRRLPGDQDHPRHVRLRTARRDPGPAVQPHGPDQLPKRAHLPRAPDAAEGHGRLPLRPPDLGRPAPGDVGDGEHGRGPLRARGQEAPDLPQAARRRPGPLRFRRSPGGWSRGAGGPAGGGEARPPRGAAQGSGPDSPRPVRTRRRDRGREGRHRRVPWRDRAVPGARPVGGRASTCSRWRARDSSSRSAG